MNVDTGVSVRELKLRGERVGMRRLSIDDIPELSSLLADSVDFHRPWVSYPSSRQALLGYLDRMNRAGGLLYAVSRMADNRLVGLISLNRVVHDAWSTCECGCCVGAEFSGHGYLTEAMALLVRHVFSDLGLHRVEALVDERNTASQRMLTAVGFRPEGVARGAVRSESGWLDQVRWAILAEDISGPDRYSEGGE